MSLAGKVCLVTGATRGLGLGIALQLGKSGATVYVTGRTLKKTEGAPGSLRDTVKRIESNGGRCIPVVCDHAKEDNIQAVFDQIKKEQNGQLDLLVNNAYAAVQDIMNLIGVPFWKHDIGMWDKVNNVGLRNHYLCTIHASNMMIPKNSGLIINVSSPGGLRYLFNVPYGIGKQALDRMACDCAWELRDHNVAMLSLWPGFAKTELVSCNVLTDDFNSGYHQPGLGAMSSGKIQGFFIDGESTEFSGKAVVHLTKDPQIMKKTGRIHLTAELAQEYGFTDEGRHILSPRSLKYLLRTVGWNSLARLFPDFIKVPYAALTLTGSKF